MTFGEKLKKARTDAGLKQSELAQKLGTTNTTISNWEKGVSKPDLDMLSYICGVLEVRASYFLQAKLSQDEVTEDELRHIRKYRDLDAHGKEMVNFVLEREHERVTSLKNKVVSIEDTRAQYMAPVAAHPDETATDEEREADDNMMKDDSEWK